MYLDPSGEFFVLACIVIGAAIGGLITYNLAKNAGYEGTDLVLLTLLGTVGGGIAGYLVAPLISGFMGSTFTIGASTSLGFNGGAATLAMTSITVTGSQIALVGSIIATSGYIFARTSKRNGYWGERYPNDHNPNHIHLKGQDGTNIRIDQSGNPLRGEGPLNSQQNRAIKQLWKEILKLFRKF